MKKLLAIGALVALPLLVYGQAFRVGRGAQFRAGTTAPSPSPTPAPRLWSKSSDNNFPYWTTTANVDYAIPVAGGSAPTVVPHANAGSGATAAIIAGTDTAFEVRITTGTSGTFGLQATVTFSRTWASKPFCVVTGADAQGAASGSATYCDRTGSSTTQLKINSDSPLTSSVEHRWIVVCLP